MLPHLNLGDCLALISSQSRVARVSPVPGSRTLCPLTSLRYAEQRVSCLSLQDVLGFNMAGLQHLKREIEAKDEVMFFADATDRFEEKKRKRKKKEKMILAVV